MQHINQAYAQKAMNMLKPPTLKMENIYGHIAEKRNHGGIALYQKKPKLVLMGPYLMANWNGKGNKKTKILDETS